MCVCVCVELFGDPYTIDITSRHASLATDACDDTSMRSVYFLLLARTILVAPPPPPPTCFLCCSCFCYDHYQCLYAVS